MSHSGLLFSQLKSFAFEVSSDLERAKRDVQQHQHSFTSTNHSEQGLNDIRNEVLTLQQRYASVENQVFGPIEQRLSHVTVEEFNARLIDLLRANQHTIDQIANKLNIASNTNNNGLNSSFNNLSMGINEPIDHVRANGNQNDSLPHFEEEYENGDVAREEDVLEYEENSMQSPMHYPHHSNDDGMEVEDMTSPVPNGSGPGISDEFTTPNSPDLSPNTKLKFQNSYQLNNSILENTSFAFGNSDRVSLTPETPGADIKYARQSIMANKKDADNSSIGYQPVIPSLQDTPPTPELDPGLFSRRINSNIPNFSLSQTNSNHSSSYLSSTAQHGGVGMPTTSASSLSSTSRSNMANPSMESDSMDISPMKSDYPMTSQTRPTTAQERHHQHDDDDDDVDKDFNTMSNFKVAKLLQPRNNAANDGWIPPIRNDEWLTLPVFLQKQVTLNQLNDSISLLNPLINESSMSFTQDELHSILQSLGDVNALKTIVMAVVYLKRLDITTEAGIKKYKVKRYY